MSSVLALVTDAFGGGGGIAQVNRDMAAALSTLASPPVVEILPRLAPKPLEPLPRRTRQHPARAGRARYTLAATRLAARCRPDVVYCGHLFMAPLAALVARRRRAKLLIHLHGIEIWDRPGPAQRAALAAADLVLCVSRDTRARAVTWADLAPERAIVLSNTVAEDYAPGDAAAARSSLGLGDDKVLLSVSRLDSGQRYKGQDRVIGLMPALIAQGHRLTYLIAGEGDDRARLEALARTHGVSDRVRFLGHVPRSYLPDLYRAADIFVLPSTGEGFGIVFLEAMACGTPALGLAVGGATDALDGLGMAVSEPELPAALDWLLHAPKPDAHDLAAKVRARYGHEVFRRCVAEAFGRLSEGGPPPSIGSRAA